MTKVSRFQKRFIAVLLSAICVISFSFPLQIFAADETEMVTEDEISPVIDNIEAVNNGGTLSGGDSMTIRVQAHGQESNISSVTLKFKWQNSGFAQTQSGTMKLGSDGIYTYTYNIYSIGKGILYVTEIKVTDEDGHETFADVMDGEDYKYLYNTVDSVSNAATLNFESEDKVYTYSDPDNLREQMKLSLSTEEAFTPQSILTLQFKAVEDTSWIKMRFRKNKENELIFDDCFAVDAGISADAEKGGIYQFVLDKAYAQALIGVIELNIQNMDECTFRLNFSKSETGLIGTPEIKAELNPKGEYVNAGDVVEISAVLTGVEDPANTLITAYFNSADETNTNQEISVALQYDTEAGKYSGIWKVDETVSPCEWYLNRFFVQTGPDHSTMVHVQNNDLAQYVKVNTGSGYVETKKDLSLYIYSIGENGKVGYDKYQYQNVSRRFTLRDLGFDLPEPSSYEGVGQTGWTTKNGTLSATETEVTDSTVFLNTNGVVNIFAEYEKPIIPVCFEYINSSSLLVKNYEIFIFENGATKAELEEKIKQYSLPVEQEGYKFTGWKVENLNNIPDILSNSCFTPDLDASAEYENAMMIHVKESYSQELETGNVFNFQNKWNDILVNKGITVSEAKNLLSQRHIGEMDEGMEFAGWSFQFSDETADRVLTEGETIVMKANYNKYRVNYYLHNADGSFPALKIYSNILYLNKGDIFTLPETIEGFDNIKWNVDSYGGKKSFVIGEDIKDYSVEFEGLGSKIPESTTEPTPDPEPSVEPTPDPEPSVEPTPDPEPSVEPTPEPEPSVEPTPAPSAEPDPQPSVEPAPAPETTPEPVPTVVFEDVAESSPYYDAIYWAAANGITTGKTATTFQPDGGCTRAQFVTFLWRMRGQPEPQAAAGFTDMVSSTSPFYKAISWAVEQGITTGYKDNTFRPNETCSRGAAVTFLYRAAGKPSVGNISTSFTDMVGRDHAYYDGIAWAIANNVTAGYKDNTFKPFRTCSRGQNVTFLYRARNIL